MTQPRPASAMGLNVQEAADELGVDRHLVGALVREGAIPHIRLGAQGGAIVIGRAALEQWLTARCMANVQQQPSEIPTVHRIRQRVQRRPGEFAS